MGQEDTCGICGEHYQSCSHYCKVHLAHPTNPEKTICGRLAIKCMIEKLDDWLLPEGHEVFDSDDKCKVCDAHREGLGLVKQNPIFDLLYGRE